MHVGVKVRVHARGMGRILYFAGTIDIITYRSAMLDGCLSNAFLVAPNINNAVQYRAS